MVYLFQVCPGQIHLVQHLLADCHLNQNLHQSSILDSENSSLLEFCTLGHPKQFLHMDLTFQLNLFWVDF